MHFHDQSRGASLTHLRQVKKLGIKTVLSYHTQGQSCPQRALLYQGESICDGELKEYRCTECQLKYLGVQKPFNYLFATQAACRLRHAAFGKVKKATQHRRLIRKFISSFREFYQTVDAIQIHAAWVKKVLMLNSISPDKIFEVTLGNDNFIYKPIQSKFPERKPLKLVFIGRCSYIKGVDVFIDAIKKLPDSMAVEVYFWGPYWNDTVFGRAMLKKIEGDGRFLAPELISNEDLPGKLSQMDICVIPSIWQETGPLTLFDAWNAGLPVIGSNIGGIKEKLQKGGGWLFERGNSDELKNLIEDIYTGKRPLQDVKIPADEILPFGRYSSQFIDIYNSVLD